MSIEKFMFRYLVLASRDYAERVAIQVLEYLLELDHFRGVGRLFVP